MVDIEKLKDLSIYELRNLARGLGIVRPTTKVRNELLNDIINITQDENFVPTGPASRRGRPARVTTLPMQDVDANLHFLGSVMTALCKNDGEIKFCPRNCSADMVRDRKSVV
jgi:hypothetical protein